MTILCGALALINLAAFCAMGVDKRRARKGAWRVSERALLTLCACFGAAGGLLGMRIFHHKTLHRQFSLGVPCLLAAQCAIAFSVWYCFFRA